MSARYPASPAPLSNQDTYTTWPGGVDPTARVYDSVGGRRARRASMTRRRRASTKKSSKARRVRRTSMTRRRR